MKRVLTVLLSVVMFAALLSGCGSEPASTIENPVVRLSTTTSVNDSGLMPILEAAFEKETGYQLEITSNGTGAAIKLGETGDADCLLVHAKASEEEFVKAGFGVERIPFMYNFFVIAGPKTDPVVVKQCTTAAEAFKAIGLNGEVQFVSRGDDSGTNKAEMKIWDATELDPVGEPWYVSAGAGMGATLTQASERQAYTLTDKATFLSMADKLDLSILLGESDDMKNTYSLIAVNPQKNAGVNIDGANAFIQWMGTDAAKELIKTYGADKYGEPLFFLLEK